MTLKKKVILIVAIALFIILLYMTFLIIHSSLTYSMMSYTEKLKAQIQEESQVYSTELTITIHRTWYSLSPEDWTFVVTFNDDKQCSYNYNDREREFVPVN